MGLELSQINIGVTADDGTGETIRTAFTKGKKNFCTIHFEKTTSF